MRKQIINRFLFVLLLALISVTFALPPSIWGENAFGNKLSEFRVTLGLDLAGGTELDYKIDLSDAIAQNEDDDPSNDVNVDFIAESVRDSLEQRINPAGVGEIIVKRAEEEDGQHVIIQMPPSSNVAKAKQDAEQDNRLEFFEEDLEKEAKERANIKGVLDTVTPWNWEAKTTDLSQDPNISFITTKDGLFKDQISDQELANKLFSAAPGTFLSDVIETQTEAEYTMNDEGSLEIKSFPRNVLALVRVTDKKKKEREQTEPATAEARHILFAYPGARRATEDVRYKSKEEAQTEAEKMLQKLQEEGTDNFAELAKEYSTESAAQESGGDLGEFTADRMVPEFSDAVFAREEPELIPELVESPFGFHVIEVQNLTPESTKTVAENQVFYEMLAWDRDELRWTPTELGGAQLENATVGYNELGQPLVNLLFDAEGGELFAKLTGNVAAKQCDDGPCRLGIKVGGRWITQPTVRERIVGRTAQITGNFTFDSAKALADGLNLGAIDAPVILSGQTTITPELGTDQLQKSLRAGLWGFITIMVFMILMYRFAGIIATISLSLYATLFVTMLKVWPESFGGPIVLTLSGIAGVVLSIGLAVDGNILIFERLKEELRRGRTLSQAIDLGFERAWAAIRDSNLTTLLTCIILFSFGSSIIKGFAITLIVGTILSMFTAVTISRNLLRFSLLFKKLNNTWLFGLNQSTQDDGKKASAKIRKRM
ncbi:protein translocase subunit SecD [Candidatus Gracilibacteria bacterium]|nr:protein translocase subunit SecD [Candidatus Gracilibacteria bacterium]